ncbi:hypothetical protein D3C73_1176840 [compost metagenome]
MLLPEALLAVPSRVPSRTNVRMTWPPPWCGPPSQKFQASIPARRTAKAWTTSCWAALNPAARPDPTWPGLWRYSPGWTAYPQPPSTASVHPACKPFGWPSTPSDPGKPTQSCPPGWRACPGIRTGPVPAKPIPPTTTRCSKQRANALRHGRPPTSRGPTLGSAGDYQTFTSPWARLPRTSPRATESAGPSRTSGVS